MAKTCSLFCSYYPILEKIFGTIIVEAGFKITSVPYLIDHCAIRNCSHGLLHKDLSFYN